MKKILILTAMIGCFCAPMAYADNKPVQLEDVDLNGDNQVSPSETKAFLQKLGQERYPETQQVRQAPMPLPPELAVTQKTIAKKPKAGIAPIVKIKNPYGEKNRENIKVPAFVQKKEGMRVDEMKALDTNNDGVLQQSELNKGAATKFNAADTNRDGILSKQEIDGSLNRIKTEKAEYGESFGSEYANRTKNRYKNADSDRDGKLSQKEYETFSKQYQQNFDQNADGVISKDEFRGEGEKLPSSYFKKPNN